MRATSLLVLCVLALLLGAHAIDTSVVAEIDTHADAETQVNVEQQLQLEAEAELEADVVAHQDQRNVFKTIGTAVKKVVTAVKNVFAPPMISGPSALTFPAFDDEVALDLMTMSAMAYCPAASLASWSCTACKRGNLVRLNSWASPGADKTQVVVAYSPAALAIYVAFQGTSNTEQWVANLETTKTKWSGSACAGCEVHTGFNKIFLSMRDTVVGFVTAAQKQYPQADIFISGHSLGGALATLMSMYLHTNVPKTAPTQLYTTGSPRVGNGQFAATLNALFGKSYFRVQNQNDVVPGVPLSGMGFKHAGTMIMCQDGSQNCNVGAIGQDVGDQGFALIVDLVANAGKKFAPHKAYFSQVMGKNNPSC